MKRIFVAGCAVIISGAVQARGADLCGYVSEYDLRVEPRSLVFHAPDREIRMQSGRLIVDGRVAPLGADDANRIRRYESQVRALVPDARKLALEAVKTAAAAVREVLATFDGPGSRQAMRRVDDLARDFSARLVTSNDTAEWDERELEVAIERLGEEIVPMLAGDVAAAAVDAAMEGDLGAADALRRQVQALPGTLEAAVERRLRPLEARARALCPRLAALDTLEGELAATLPGGARLDLLEAER